LTDRIKKFTDLLAWKEAHQLVVVIYKLTNDYPTSEKFGLISQMRRCAVSITSNIAEGFSRYSNKDKVRFYYISTGSISELQNQLIISKDIGLLNDGTFEKVFKRSETVFKIINGLIRSINH